MKNNYVPASIKTREEEKRICDETIGRFEEYINEQLKRTNGDEKKMEEQIELKKVEDIENNATKNPWDEVGGTYVKLEKDKAKFLLLINWKVEKIKKFKDEELSKKLGREVLKEQMEFSADVLSEDGTPCNKIFSTTSINALLGLKEIFNPYFLTNNNTPKMIRIKKMGEGKSTIYDVEEQRLK